MLHKKTWSILFWTLRLSAFFSFIPYKVIRKNNLTLLGPFRMFIFYINLLVVVGYTVFAFARIPKSLDDPTLKFFDIFNHILVLSFHLLIAIFYLSNLFYMKRIVIFFNEFVRLNEVGQKEYEFEKSKYTIRELFVWNMPACVSIGFLLALMFVMNPHIHNYVFTLLPAEHQVKYSSQFWWFAFFELYVGLSELGSGCSYAAVQMSLFHSFLMWIEIMADAKMMAGKTLAQMIEMYRRWQMMIGVYYNECFSMFLTPLCTIQLAFLGTLANYGTIRLIHNLDDPAVLGNLYATVISWGDAIFVFLFYTNAATFEFLSTRVKEDLMHKQKDDGPDEFLLRKRIKAMPPFQVWVAHFYCLKKTSSAVYLTGIVQYTLSLLIAYPP